VQFQLKNSMAGPFYLAPAFVFQHLPPQPPLFEFKFDFNFLLLAAVFRGLLAKGYFNPMQKPTGGMAAGSSIN